MPPCACLNRTLVFAPPCGKASCRPTGRNSSKRKRWRSGAPLLAVFWRGAEDCGSATVVIRSEDETTNVTQAPAPCDEAARSGAPAPAPAPGKGRIASRRISYCHLQNITIVDSHQTNLTEGIASIAA